MVDWGLAGGVAGQYCCAELSFGCADARPNGYSETTFHALFHVLMGIDSVDWFAAKRPTDEFIDLLQKQSTTLG